MLKPMTLLCSLSVAACMVGEDPIEILAPAAPSQLEVVAAGGESESNEVTFTLP